MTKYIATEALDRLRTEDNNFLVTEDSGPPTTTTPAPTTTTTAAPVVVGDYVTGFYIRVANTNINTLSAYVYATPLECVVNVPSTVSPATVLNNFSIVILYGDGTESEITQITDTSLIAPAHVYNWPGQYEVKMVVLPKTNNPVTSFTKILSAYNYVQDNLEWVYAGWSGLSAANLNAGAVFHGFQSCKPGEFNSATPLTFRFTTSSILSSRVSFDLYSQGSSSQPWDAATLNNKHANLRPRWSFQDLSGNNITNIVPKDIQTTPINIDAFGVETASGTLVGYTGTLDVYYVDDIPSLSYNGGTYRVTTPTLWIVANTNNYFNYQDKNDGQRSSYSNSTVTLSTLFYVKNLSATHYNVTVNGGSIALPSTIWPSTSGSIIVTVNSEASSVNVNSDFGNKSLLNYPINYNNSNTVIYSVPNQATTFAASSFTFSRTDALGRDTGGFYKNKFYTPSVTSPLLSSGILTTTILVSAGSATVIAEPPANALSGYNPATRVAAAIATGAVHVVPLTGSITYNIVDFDKNYFVRKINEDFNYGAQLQAYALQPTIAAATNLFALLSSMAGDSYTTKENFGTVVYEKTANFVANTQDVYTANVNSLYSLAGSIDNTFDDFNLNAPPSLKRALDLYSIPHERLWGTREKNNTNFNNANNHTNLGYSLTAYDIKTAVVSAGQKIVLNSIFDSSFYELLEVPTINSYASVTAANMQSHFTSGMSYPLTAYPLSAFFGWGVSTPVESYYKFWVYNDVYSNTPVCNTIDWNTKTDGLSTTLSESASSITEWYKDGGILENIYSYYLYKGLDLV